MSGFDSVSEVVLSSLKQQGSDLVQTEKNTES